MAIRLVRFEFYCGEEEFKYIYDILRSFVTAGVQAVQKARYKNVFVETIQLIIKKHETVCITKSKAFCENCGSAKTTVLQTPMFWLYKIDDPFVVV
jgi:hypothetical protein